ncbi:MAG: hypothetical protein HQL54_10505 [Magnetococcales bacterium]|nr:hypothetical protein [Magnetococcales bacterium]
MATLSKFEQFSKNFTLSLVSISLVLLLLEGASFLILRAQGIVPNQYNFAQIISGYHVFRNTPGIALWNEVKENPSDPPTTIDWEAGFYSDNPISVEKPEGVIRIFIMGGSAMYGIGQFPPFAEVHPYHLGVLSYALGPAGQLERYLQKQRPDLKFEVINAAATDRLLHQSMIYYLETISRYSPDIVINVDGYNDLYFGMMSGRPYAQVESRIGNYINLWNNAGAYQPNVMRLFMLGYQRFIHPMVDEQLKQQFFFKEDLNQEKYGFAAYKEVEESFIQSTQRFLQILDHYMAVLKADDVDFIFGLQPQLYRQINKEWSEIENRMRTTVFGVGPNMAPELIERLILMSKFFFDEYLSDASRARVMQNQFDFVDINQEIQSLKSDFELYIDYCHFTVPGSKKVAEILGQRVLKRLPAPRSEN